MEKGKKEGTGVRKSALQSPQVKFPRVGGEGGEENVTDDVMGDAVPGVPPPGIPVLPGGGVGSGSNEDGENEIGLADLMKKMEQMNTNMINQFEHVRIHLENQACSFKTELEQLRAEMVSQDQFQNFERRLENLEKAGLGSSQLTWMQQQIQKLDPANKSLCFKGFKESKEEVRCSKIEEFLDSLGLKNEIKNIDHQYKFDQGNRSILPVYIVEVSCRSVRESVLTKIDDKKFHDGNGGTVEVQRAKTSLQLKRNASLAKACDKLKGVDSCKGKSVEIAWKIEGSRDRGVKLDGNLMFK